MLHDKLFEEHILHLHDDAEVPLRSILKLFAEKAIKSKQSRFRLPMRHFSFMDNTKSGLYTFHTHPPVNSASVATTDSLDDT